LGRRRLDSSVYVDPIRDDCADDVAGQSTRCRVGLDLREIAFQDRGRRPLPEVRFEDSGQCHAPAGPQ
jgi:hypothetical protein